MLIRKFLKFYQSKSRFGSLSAINSQSPVSNERLVNLEKLSSSDSQLFKLGGEMVKYLF
ncbi:hypothetical protein NSMM_980039 [Nitrosomonas mobilis]|uniref:Uncharacterized protein n=1 Tax=Nitrosomonas mobilis TaxID=51642 RepID=A0A1G5SJF3_9PROT|nr:hypothetical protein NSMM_980039 [Nitrosomonas mobilis]